MAFVISVHGVRLIMGRHSFKEIRHPLLTQFNNFELLLKPPFRPLLDDGLPGSDCAAVMKQSEVMHLICSNPKHYPAESMAELKKLISGYDMLLVHGFES